MKKILLPILALGGLLFVSSCQMDEPDAGTLTGEVDFSITAGIPSGITTYAEGAEAFSHQGGASNLSTDDYILRYTLQVYDEDEKLSYEGVQYATDFGGVTFEARLLAKVYDFVFWADFVSASDQESDLYYNTEDLRKISYTSSVTDANIPSDALDAYYKKEVVNLTQAGQNISNVFLNRPFGKIRFVATDDLSEQQKGAVDNGKVSVVYKEGTVLPNVFDAQTGKATISEEYQTRMPDFTATLVAEKASVNGNVHENAYLLGYDYIFCSESQPSYAMDVTVSIEGVSPVTRSLSSIPVQENKLTTVIGNFYTNEGSIDVIVEDGFTNGEEAWNEEGAKYIGTVEELLASLKNGKSIILSNNIQISENTSISIPSGIVSSIDLNGHVLSTTNSEGQTFQDMFEVVGTLNISNGTVQFKYTGDNMEWNGGTAVFNVHGGGILNMEDVVVNDLGGTDMSFCVHLNNWGDVTLKADNCVFNSPYCGVRVFNSGPDINKVTITNSELKGATRAFWVHNYIGDFSTSTSDEDIKNRLNIDIYNNNNTFLLTETAISPIRYGFGNPVYFTENGKLADLPVIDDNNNTVQISSASAMSAFAIMVNNGETFENYTVTLNTNIDLNNVAWTPIGPNGDGKNKFMGTFDGCNHTISNLKVTQKAGYHAAGLFGALNGTVKDLIIDGATIENLSSGSSTVNGTAVVAGSIYPSGLIDNVTVKNATVQGNRYLGGISGYVYGSIKNCSVEAITLVATPDNLTGAYDNGDKVGGIVGYIVKDGSNGTVENCTVKNAIIQGYRDIGGIAGCANSFEGQEVVINGCSVSDITLTQDFTNGYKTEAADVSTIGSIFGRGYIAESNVNNETDISILVKVYDPETAQLALDAASSARTIEFADGTYDMTKLTAITGKTLTFVGAGEKTIFDYSSQQYGQYVNGGNGTFVFKNMTIQRSTETFAGMAHTASTSYENCTITGTYYVYETTAKFTDCKFNVKGDFYNCWTWGALNATFEGCTFNSDGKAMLLYGTKDTKLTINKCTFNDSDVLDVKKAAIEIGDDYDKSYTLVVNETDVNGFAINDEGINTGTTLWANKNSMGTDKLSVTVDGEKVY